MISTICRLFRLGTYILILEQPLEKRRYIAKKWILKNTILKNIQTIQRREEKREEKYTDERNRKQIIKW